MGLLKAASKYQSDETTGVEITDEYREVFVVEAREHLEEWESALLELEHQPDDQDLINQIFRAIHTLKGSAGFIGFEELQRLSHDLESTLQSVRDGEQPLTPTRTDFLFRGLDMSKRMVEAFVDGVGCEEDVDGFLAQLAESEGIEANGTATANQSPAAAVETETAFEAPNSAPAEAPKTGSSGGQSRKLILEVLVDSTGREAFLRAFLLRSRIAAVATILAEEPAPETLKDSTGRFNYTITLLTDKDESEIRTAANVDQIELLSLGAAKEPEVPAAQGSSAPEKKERAEEPRHEKAARHDEVVRVSVERLDNLLNLVGELVVQNSNFASLSEELSAAYGRHDTVLKLQEKTEGLAKITRDLQDGIMKVRMLPVNTVFMRFHRVVRDLAHSSGKDVTLDIFGGETEIDKKVIDRIGDPLVHLIRNAVDHGIESKEERAASGKPTTSSVRLGAYQDGDHICIEVSDDGKGLNQQAILKKAREKGLIGEADQNLPEERILDLIFQPGFSTAETITDVSGRGVGMDAVKKAIEGLGGSLRIRSFVGRGTTITITLPLTMAIIRAVLVEVDDLTVAIPLSAVKEVLKVTAGEMQSVGLRQVIRLREEVLAVVYLSEVLELEEHETAKEEHRFPVIVVDYDGRKIGIGVDRVIGTHEIVIKSLSRHYKEVDGFIGATILGDGRIALIVDVEAIVRQYHRGNTVSSKGSRIPGAIEAGGDLRALPNDEESDSFTVPPDVEEAEPAAQPSENNELYERASEVLSEVGSSGALRASMALSQITGTDVRVGFPESHLVKISEIADSLGGEEAQIAGIYVGVTGGLRGGILISIPAEQLPVVHSYLHGDGGKIGAGGDPLDMSAIGEFGNLLSASFINAIGDETEIRTQIEAPEISVDMCLSILDSVVARFNSAGDDTLLTKAVVFFGEDEQIGCSLMLFLEPESLERLLTAFASVPA